MCSVGALDRKAGKRLDAEIGRSLWLVERCSPCLSCCAWFPCNNAPRCFQCSFRQTGVKVSPSCSSSLHHPQQISAGCLQLILPPNMPYMHPDTGQYLFARDRLDHAHLRQVLKSRQSHSFQTTPAWQTVSGLRSCVSSNANSSPVSGYARIQSHFSVASYDMLSWCSTYRKR